MLELRKLSPALQKKANAELNESDDRIKDDVAALREWLAKQPHINARDDEQFLINFLRGCKYSVEKTKQKLDIYYTARSQLPKYFKNRNVDSPHTQKLIKMGFIVPLPTPDGEDGPRIVLVRPGCFDPSEYTVQDMMAALTVTSDYANLMDDHIFVAGYKVVIDAAGVKTGHVLQYDPVFMKQMVNFYQNGCAGRFQGAYFLNLPGGLDTFINFGKSLLNEKNKTKINILGSDFRLLYEHIPKNLLPSEYGGDAGTVEEIMTNLIKRVKEMEVIIKEEEDFGVDESKRGSDSKNIDGLFGSVGTFRSLNLD